MKIYNEINVLDASKSRIKEVFDNFEFIYVSFSGGKDSTVMLHLVMDEAVKRNRTVGVLIIDLEAQYSETIKHIENMYELYKDNIDLHWFCGELLLRNAVTNFEPRWICWDHEKEDVWVRKKPKLASNLSQYPFYVPQMEFEEIMVLFGQWYGGKETSAAFVGIRADESLNRYCAIATWNKEGRMFNDRRWTTKVGDSCFNIYPIYDWKTNDVWIYQGKNPNKPHNTIYDKMQMAGVKLSQQRLCQPYGDDQRKGLWLYHVIEPETWPRLIARVNGVNSGALFSKEKGNANGEHKVIKPDGHTWKSYTNVLIKTLPEKTREHYIMNFKKFIIGWKRRGYKTIPDEAPRELEAKCWAPSWRRMARCILRNDYWCKGLGFTQPKSEAYNKYKILKSKNALKQRVIS